MIPGFLKRALRPVVDRTKWAKARARRKAGTRIVPGFGGEPDFVFVDPPFNLNSPNYAHIPQEVTGRYLLRSLQTRLGWESFADKRILDFGCGVRMTRTFVNLGIEILRYHGVDNNKPMIEWLSENVKRPGFSYTWVDDRNPLYNPGGSAGGGHKELIEQLSPEPFDLAYLYSVITHNDPGESRRIFKTMRSILGGEGAMYFTAFLDEGVGAYAELNARRHRARSTYHPDLLRSILAEAGWRVESIYPSNFVQQQAILCRAI